MPIVRKDYLTPPEVAKELHIHPESVRRWARTGRLTELGIATHLMPGGRWLIHKDVLTTQPK